MLSDINLEFAKGTFNLIQGPSGCGKTTFLRLMNRLEEPSAGEIYFNDRQLKSYPSQLLRRSVLYLQQIPTAVEGTVAENLLFPFEFKHNKDLRRPDVEKLNGLLADFQLGGIGLDDNAGTLSVGQLQRVCFLRAMLLSPDVMLLDEPASALDEESGRIVERTAERLCREKGLTVFMVTHRRFRPEKIRPSLYVMENGTLHPDVAIVEDPVSKGRSKVPRVKL
ncbi:MAG: ATP-binding cassette domain-containing protein [Deltaproteobacteria bacterium]|nr:ATP-binding cassette domain-containing protein [Deltaproteobacteria bacterium]